MNKVFTLVVILNITSCNTNKTVTANTEEVQHLVINMLQWSNSENSIDLLPAVADTINGTYIKFDLESLRSNLSRLTETHYFSEKFINNYEHIILTLDRQLRNNELELGTWYVNEMPPFNFASEVSPWCLCQDNFEWDQIQVFHKSGNAYYWKWKIDSIDNDSWSEYSYSFNIEKHDNQWKISDLEGFRLNTIE